MHLYCLNWIVTIQFTLLIKNLKVSILSAKLMGVKILLYFNKQIEIENWYLQTFVKREKVFIWKGYTCYKLKLRSCDDCISSASKTALCPAGWLLRLISY